MIYLNATMFVFMIFLQMVLLFEEVDANHKCIQLTTSDCENKTMQYDIFESPYEGAYLLRNISFVHKYIDDYGHFKSLPMYEFKNHCVCSSRVCFIKLSKSFSTTIYNTLQTYGELVNDPFQLIFPFSDGDVQLNVVIDKEYRAMFSNRTLFTYLRPPKDRINSALNTIIARSYNNRIVPYDVIIDDFYKAQSKPHEHMLPQSWFINLLTDLHVFDTVKIEQTLIPFLNAVYNETIEMEIPVRNANEGGNRVKDFYAYLMSLESLRDDYLHEQELYHNLFSI